MEGYGLYVNDRALHRYTLVNGVAGVYGDVGEFYGRINQGYDYSREVFLWRETEAEVSEWLGAQPGPPLYRLKAERSTQNELALSVYTEGRALFLFNEYYNRNWKARVNGSPARLLRVNLNQMGVLLEKGGNLVEFEYRPTLFIWMLRLQKSTLALLALYLLSVALKPLFGRLRIRRNASA